MMRANGRVFIVHSHLILHSKNCSVS